MNKEEKILSYINEYEKTEYEKVLQQDQSLDTIMALSNIRENLLNWYPFEKKATLLEVNSEYGALTGMFCDKVANVTTIVEKEEHQKAVKKRHNDKENLSVIAKDEKESLPKKAFDYIVITEIKKEEQDIKQYLKTWIPYLTENGTILLSVNNTLGISQNNGIQDLEELEQEKTVTKRELEDVIHELGYHNTKFYYPLPNEKLPNIIFTDDKLPSQESILRDLTLYHEKGAIVFDEREQYRALIKQDKELFSIFANSFLVEITNSENLNSIKMISFGNSRKPEYRLKTVMLEDEVYKEAVNQVSQKHLEEMRENIEILNKSNINLLDTWREQKIYSKLIKDTKSFDKVLIEIYETKGIESVFEKIKEFEEELKSKLEKSDEKCQNVFEKYGLRCYDRENEKLTFIKHGLFDLIFQNCFVIDGKFYFYDQEWKEENLPLEFILYRAIYYLGNSKQGMDVGGLYEKLGITPYLEEFEKLETLLQEKIKDEVIWNVHAGNNQTIRNLYDKMIHERNLMAENSVQQLQTKENRIKEQEKTIEQQKEMIEKQQLEINYMKNSKSWKLTKPLRMFRKKLKE